MATRNRANPSIKKWYWSVLMKAFRKRLSTKQKSNIRFFIYYLVNGSLNYERIESTFKGKYFEVLKAHPDYFYKTASVFINQEVHVSSVWPNTDKLGQFICNLYKNELNATQFEAWELDFTFNMPGLSSDFKRFTQWFIEKITNGHSYYDYITNGASHVEQCFAIWANVVVINNGRVINFDDAIERVDQYLKSYYIKDFKSNLKDWECELHFE